MEIQPGLPLNEVNQSKGAPAGNALTPSCGDPPSPIGSKGAHWMIIFDLPTKQTELYVLLFMLH